MALRLHVKKVSGLRGKADRAARATFRGVSHYTRVCENSEQDIVFDDIFEWPLGRAVESQETLSIQIINRNKYLANKVVGSYCLVLQHVVTDGHVVICDDTLVDANNQPLACGITFEIFYTPPPDSMHAGGQSGAAAIPRSPSGRTTARTSGQTSGIYRGYSSSDDEQSMLDLERNIQNLEKSYASRAASASSGQESDDSEASLLVPGDGSKGVRRKRSLPSTMRSIANMMKLGSKQKHRRTASAHNPQDALSDDMQQASHYQHYAGSTHSLLRHMSDNTLNLLSAREGRQNGGNESVSEGDGGGTSPGVGDTPYAIKTPVVVKKQRVQHDMAAAALKAQDFQVCVTVIEGRHLAGLNMDPVVCVQVGELKKYTSVKESTNCPYYNEYFVFDFHMAPAMLFDKMITITALHSRNIIRSGKVIGTFKLDVGTVFMQQDHQFYHKWMLLTDPEDITTGPKGYIKCDVAVVGKGDTAKPPPKVDTGDDDDIEGNLLLPDGAKNERQHARYIIRVYRADGLPRHNASLVSNVKKAFSGPSRELLDPYVQASFAGLTGRTTVKKSCCSPVWNEQIVFTEMFPPLCQRIKIQIRDNDPVNDTVIGTHFIEIGKISNEGEKGFLPTFGPSFVYMYGSVRDNSLFEEHLPLNSGMGEGVMYRGRILLAVRTEIMDFIDIVPPMVDLEVAPPIDEDSLGKNEEFLLFGCLLEASMIDKRLGEKPISFELSIGNAGNMLDGGVFDDSDQLESVLVEDLGSQSTTKPVKPASNDRFYYYLPFNDTKPCVWVKSTYQDHRRRIYNSNMLLKILEKLDAGLADIHEMIRLEKSHTERRLRGVLEELATECHRYLSHLKTVGSSGCRTPLDKERHRFCHREVDHIGTMARALKPLVTKKTFKDRLRTTVGFQQKLRQLIDDSQHALPDVFLWMLSGGKRVAYCRFLARDLIYSAVEDESGKFCGRVQTIFLKPGKKVAPSMKWMIQSKLQVFLWLGPTRFKKILLKGVPDGYELTPEVKNVEMIQAPPPTRLRYVERAAFQLRAHMYQARSLIGSDASGLSDPFARVVFLNQSQTTQVIDQTLSPTWDEMLLFEDIVLFGSCNEDVREEPPLVVIEIFDQDNVGKSEFLGRAIARPHVKFLDEPYTKPNFPPILEWHDIYRGTERAGELLATFELLQVPYTSRKRRKSSTESTSSSGSRVVVPDLPAPKEHVWRTDRGPVLPVPKEIRPTLSQYRIAILFWGLRDLKRVHLLTVDRPRVDIECAGHILQSSVILNYKKNPNFATPVKFFDVELPDQEMYCPPLTIRVIDCRSFGRYTLVGTHIVSSLHRFMHKIDTNDSTKERSNGGVTPSGQKTPQVPYVEEGMLVDLTSNEKTPLISKDALITLDVPLRKPSLLGGKLNALNQPPTGTRNRKSLTPQTSTANEEDLEESRDWWTRYFASVERMVKESQGEVDDYSTEDGVTLSVKESRRMEKELQRLEQNHAPATIGVNATEHVAKKKGSAASRIAHKLSPKAQRHKPIEEALIKIYTCELENVPDFNAFKEWLHTFDLYRGKRTGDEMDDQSRVVGYFKGSLKVLKHPIPAESADEFLFQGLPSNEPLHVLVRVYVVKASDLHPADLNGKADPYIVINLGSRRTSDKENYVSKQLNPVFGKCFEIEATFPQDSLLTVQIYDWDLLGTDDLIGETKIDLENRFYSKHRATCGLPLKYELNGPNQWRHPLKPSQLLNKLCKDNKLEAPIFMGNRVRIGTKVFNFQTADGHHSVKGDKMFEEHQSLAILSRWDEIPKVGCKLVPEHVETRALFHPEKPGIEQGKLEMWVDLFPMDQPLPGPPIDISPRKPKSYELRVIIWNTDDVVLEDDAFFTGEKMSDIYVKGWVKGQEDSQCTDIHYRSLTGEGNFNWRFIFPFDYLPAEEKIVISRKESLFSWDETECKIPARLELQVWDADHFSADDFLGAITIDLNRFPRGAKSSKLCTLDMLRPEANIPHLSLFKQRRVKGWWPFFIKKDNEEMELTGKVEAELHLLTKEDAEKNPAGLGRNEPDPLEKPNRPDSSFVWFLNPLKSIRYIIWHQYKWVIIKVIVCLLLVLLLAIFVYSVPGYTVKKMLGA